MGSTTEATTTKKKRKEPDTTTEENHPDWEKELTETKKELVDTKQKLAKAEERAKTAEALVKSLKAKAASAEEQEGELSDDDDESVSDDKDTWSIRYKELREYRIKNGNCNVARKANPKLGIWVKNQRALYKGKKNGEKLSPEKISKLERIGFQWGKDSPQPVEWETQFEELEKFQMAMGHCNVPINPNSPSALAKWVSAQRSEYKRFQKGKGSLLTLGQIKQLKDIGFKWKSPKLP
jgi:chromosome segregation ATPase